MPPLKQKPKTVAKDTRSSEEIAIQSAINSSYHCMHPMVDAAYVRLKNPVDGRDYHFSTDDPKFLAMLWELSQKGMEQKIMSDLQYFADNYDSKWNTVIQLVNGYFKANQTSQ